MSWFTDLFTSGAEKVVDSIAGGLDKLFTSDDERLRAKLLLEQEMNKFKVEVLNAQSQYDKEITERWKSDNEHAVTRLVRPVSYGVMLSLFLLVALFDGNLYEFTVDPEYIPVMENLLMTMTIAYFGSRGIEKSIKTWKK